MLCWDVWDPHYGMYTCTAIMLYLAMLEWDPEVSIHYIILWCCGSMPVASDLYEYWFVVSSKVPHILYYDLAYDQYICSKSAALSQQRTEHGEDPWGAWCNMVTDGVWESNTHPLRLYDAKVKSRAHWNTGRYIIRYYGHGTMYISIIICYLTKAISTIIILKCWSYTTSCLWLHSESDSVYLFVIFPQTGPSLRLAWILWQHSLCYCIVHWILCTSYLTSVVGSSVWTSARKNSCASFCFPHFNWGEISAYSVVNSISV